MTGRDWAHLLLGIAGCIPYVGIVANVVNAVLYFEEGDALSGILCIAGAAIGVGGIMSAASGATCAIKTAGMALRTAGTAYVATTMVRETVENAEITLDLLYENGGELNGDVLLSAAQTVLCGVGAVAGFAEVGKCISSAATLSASGMACFVAGTQVLTREGLKNIEDVEAGDYVYSTNDETGESDYKEVLRVFEKETEVITHVFYEVQSEGGESTETKEIETTLNHPFWCEGEWKAAGTLKEGDVLTLADGSTVSVTEITYEDRHTTVYNMEVADYHTYYVGEDNVWVHNDCGPSGETGTSGETVSEAGKRSATSGFDKWLNKGASDNKVYFGIKGEEAKYTGITKQTTGARLAQHNSKGKGFSELRVQYDGLTRNQARAIEQYYIENGPNAMNKINSISPKNKYYNDALKWAEQFIMSH